MSNQLRAVAALSRRKSA